MPREMKNTFKELEGNAGYKHAVDWEMERKQEARDRKKMCLYNMASM